MDTEIDVIVFESGDRRFAVDLRRVQEVFTLGYVTPIPLTPPMIQGATNVRGRMVPVVSISPLFGRAAPPRVLPGTPAILVHVEGTAAALPVQRVVDVVSVPRKNYEQGGEGSGALIPGSFRGTAGSVPLLDVPSVLEKIAEATQEANERVHLQSEAR